MLGCTSTWKQSTSGSRSSGHRRSTRSLFCCESRLGWVTGTDSAFAAHDFTSVGGWENGAAIPVWRMRGMSKKGASHEMQWLVVRDVLLADIAMVSSSSNTNRRSRSSKALSASIVADWLSLMETPGLNCTQVGQNRKHQKQVVKFGRLELS